MRRRRPASGSRSAPGRAAVAPGARHQDKANTVRFVSRAISSDVTAETSFNDVKTVLEFLLTVESAIGEAVGLDSVPGDE